MVPLFCMRRGAVRLVRFDSEETQQQYPSDLLALFEIEPLARGLMYLVEVEGWDIASAAAAALGCSPSAARQRLSRARRRLRVALAEAD